MEWGAFGLLLYDNIYIYISCLLASVLLYYFIFRRTYISILDPWILSTVFSCFGFSVVWFLYFTNSIDVIYLYSYLLTQGAFWLGLFTFNNLKKGEILSKATENVLKNENNFIKIFFLVSSFLYVIIQILSYSVIGIPLFIGSHVDIYSNSGGWGILGRFLDVLKPISIFFLIHVFFKFKKSLFWIIYKYVFLVIILTFFGLSASKGEFMNVGVIFFCYVLLNSSYNWNYLVSLKKIEKKIVLVGLFFVFLTISLQAESGNSSLSVFLFRLVASGDTYYFAYPNHNIEALKADQPFLALFGDLFSTLRLIPREAQPQTLGIQLFRMFNKSDIIAGPNSRHNVFGYAYFGFYLSIIFSYAIGILLSYIRNKSFYKLRKNIITQLIFVFLYSNLISLETDPSMAFSGIENALLIFPVILFIAIVFFTVLGFKKVRKKVLW